MSSWRFLLSCPEASDGGNAASRFVVESGFVAAHGTSGGGVSKTSLAAVICRLDFLESCCSGCGGI